MSLSRKYICYFLLILVITADITSARRRRKICDGSLHEFFSSCANPCKQMTCEDRAYNTTFQPCNDTCQSGCICQAEHVRREGPTDPCVKKC